MSPSMAGWQSGPGAEAPRPPRRAAPVVGEPGPMAGFARDDSGAPPPQGATATPRGGRGKRFWWSIACLVMALALAFCAWFARYLLPVWFVPLGPGVTYVDNLGTAYTVLQRTEQTHYEDSSDTHEPAAGAVFLEYIVQVDGYRPEVLTNRQLNMCTFKLVGSRGQIWDQADIYQLDRESRCDRDHRATSFQFFIVFEVPVAMVPEVLGLMPERLQRYPYWGFEQILSEPR